MDRVAKVTISLPHAVLAAVDRQRQARDQSRSDYVRAAVERFLEDQQYIRGYQEYPETDEEVQSIHAAGQAVLVQESWE